MRGWEGAEDFLSGEELNSPPLLDETLGFFSSERLPPADDFHLLLELSWLGSDLTRDSPGSREGCLLWGREEVGNVLERMAWSKKEEGCLGLDGLEEGLALAGSWSSCWDLYLAGSHDGLCREEARRKMFCTLMGIHHYYLALAHYQAWCLTWSGPCPGCAPSSLCAAAPWLHSSD